MTKTEEIMELVEAHRCAGGSAEHHATKNALKAAIEELAKDAAGWQLIETAPLDGTEVTLFGDALWPAGIVPEYPHLYGVVSPGYYAGGIWQMCGRIGKPSHWMPLPKPPAMKKTP